MTDFIQLLVSGIATGTIYALAALGFTLLWQASGTINFATGEFVMVSAFLMLAGLGLGLPLWASYLLSLIAATVILGYFFKRAVVDPLIRHGIMPVIVATIGLSLVAKNGIRIGFGAQVRGKDDRSISELLKEVQTEDLIKFGLIPELIGRLPVVATLAQLDEAALVQILTEPNNALVKQYQALLDMEGVELEIRPAALGAIAKKAIARKTGARGLRSIIEHALMDVMYDLPSLKNVQRVVIDESTINGEGQPLMLYQEASEKAAS